MKIHNIPVYINADTELTFPIISYYYYWRAVFKHLYQDQSNFFCYLIIYLFTHIQQWVGQTKSQGGLLPPPLRPMYTWVQHWFRPTPHHHTPNNYNLT